MTAICSWCKEPTGEPIAVGLVERGSGPPATTHACPTYRDLRGIIPVDEWEHVGDGRPQYYPTGEPHHA